MECDYWDWFNIKMPSYQYRKSHCGDKTILRPSHLNNGIYHTGKMASYFWIRPLDVVMNPICKLMVIHPCSIPPHCYHPPPASHCGLPIWPWKPGPWNLHDDLLASLMKYDQLCCNGLQAIPWNGHHLGNWPAHLDCWNWWNDEW